MKEIKLSILVGVSILFLMPNVAKAQDNIVGQSIDYQSSSISVECDLKQAYCRIR